jgi:serine/threonine protein phosphatase PrpC
MSSPMQEKFQSFEDEIRERDIPPARPVSRWARLGASVALVLTGLLLYWLPGSIPPPAWIALLRLARARELFPLTAHLVPIGGSAALLVAYILWLYAAVRVLLLFRRSDPRLALSQPAAASPGTAEQEQDAAAVRGEVRSTPEETAPHERQTRPLERESGDHADGRAPVHLHNLVLQTSSQVRSRPALPSVLLGPGDIGLFGRPEAREGIGLAVASCCHAGRGKRAAALEDATLAASGLALWPEVAPGVVPVGLYVVADGGIARFEGGCYSTSQLAVQLLGQALLPLLFAAGPPEEATVGQGLADGIQRANAALWQRAASVGVVEGAAVETAFAAALVLGTTAYIANVGNSRTYYYHPGDGLSQLTFDHAAARGAAAPEASARPADREPRTSGQLYRSLGSADQVEAYLCTTHLEVGDILLLCSDGFWERVERSLIEQTLQWFASAPGADPFRLCSVLQERALERGSVDHLSITAVQVMRLAEEGQEPQGRTARLWHSTVGAG